MCREKRRALGRRPAGLCLHGPVPGKALFQSLHALHTPPLGLLEGCISSVIESSILSLTHSLIHSESIYPALPMCQMLS